MITKIFQILIISFLIVPFAYSEGTIKFCGDNYVSKTGMNYLVFPDDGGKPYGVFIELILTFTNELELKLEFEKDSFDNCLKKLRSGEIDIMAGVKGWSLDMLGKKKEHVVMWELIDEELGQVVDFIPYNAGAHPSNVSGNIAISKNSKYSTKVADFKEVSFKYGYEGTKHFACVIFPKCKSLPTGEWIPAPSIRRNYQNSLDHTWYGYEKEEKQKKVSQSSEESLVEVEIDMRYQSNIQKNWNSIAKELGYSNVKKMIDVHKNHENWDRYKKIFNNPSKFDKGKFLKKSQ